MSNDLTGFSIVKIYWYNLLISAVTKKLNLITIWCLTINLDFSSSPLTNKKDFSFLLSVIKQSQQEQQKVYKQVNKALLELYWQVGKYVSEKVVSGQCGKFVIEYLQNIFLKMNNFKLAMI